jgi:hypothetical protein
MPRGYLAFRDPALGGGKSSALRPLADRWSCASCLVVKPACGIGRFESPTKMLTILCVIVSILLATISAHLLRRRRACRLPRRFVEILATKCNGRCRRPSRLALHRSATTARSVDRRQTMADIEILLARPPCPAPVCRVPLCRTRSQLRQTGAAGLERTSPSTRRRAAAGTRTMGWRFRCRHTPTRFGCPLQSRYRSANTIVCDVPS